MAAVIATSSLPIPLPPLSGANGEPASSVTTTAQPPSIYSSENEFNGTQSTTSNLLSLKTQSLQLTIWRKLNSVLMLVLALVAIIMTALLFKPQSVATKIAIWTSHKDFREYCQGVEQGKGTLSDSCIDALKTILPPPPAHRARSVRSTFSLGPLFDQHHTLRSWNVSIVDYAAYEFFVSTDIYFASPPKIQPLSRFPVVLVLLLCATCLLCPFILYCGVTRPPRRVLPRSGGERNLEYLWRRDRTRFWSFWHKPALGSFRHCELSGKNEITTRSRKQASGSGRDPLTMDYEKLRRRFVKG